MKKLTIIGAFMMMFALAPLAAHAQYVQYPWLGLWGCAAFPTGDLADTSDNGGGGGLGVGMLVNPMVLLKATASYHRFSDDNATSGTIEGAFAPLEVGSNLYFGYLGALRPYVSLHGGWFVAAKDFDESDFGIGGGPGIDIPIGDGNKSIFIEPNYNIVFGDNDENIEYWTINIGFSFAMTPPSPIQSQN